MHSGQKVVYMNIFLNGRNSGAGVTALNPNSPEEEAIICMRLYMHVPVFLAFLLKVYSFLCPHLPQV